MSDLPTFDRIMWRGRTLAAMSEDELRSALRECWIERRDRARAAKPEPKPVPHSGAERILDAFEKILRKTP